MPFDFQPLLRGDLVQARPLQSSDFEALYTVASDPLIWAQHPARDRHQRDVFTRFFAAALASGGALTVTTPSGEVIGSSRFHAYDEQDSEVEIGWTFLARAYWGGRVNGQLKALIVEHAFRFVERVVFLADPDNVRSRRALAKIGAVRAGTGLDGAGNPSLRYVLCRPGTDSTADGTVREAGQLSSDG